MWKLRQLVISKYQYIGVNWAHISAQNREGKKFRKRHFRNFWSRSSEIGGEQNRH